MIKPKHTEETELKAASQTGRLLLIVYVADPATSQPQTVFHRVKQEYFLCLSPLCFVAADEESKHKKRLYNKNRRLDRIHIIYLHILTSDNLFVFVHSEIFNQTFGLKQSRVISSWAGRVDSVQTSDFLFLFDITDFKPSCF